MRNQLLNTLLAASLATVTMSAFAQTAPQNATPREPTAGQATPQNGSPVGTTPSAAPTQPGMNAQPGARARMTDEQIRAYIDARQACTSYTGAQLASCNDEANKKFSNVDPKCQKVAGRGAGGLP